MMGSIFLLGFGIKQPNQFGQFWFKVAKKKLLRTYSFESCKRFKRVVKILFNNIGLFQTHNF